MTPATALASVIANITTNGRGEITGAVMRGVLDQIIALDDNAGAIKSPVKAATTANITLSGAQTIDGVSIVAGDRVLVKDQSTGSQNGIYVAASGAWTRGVDFDAAATVLEGSFIWVMQGTTNAQTGWLQTAASPVIGTTALVFTQVIPGAGSDFDIYAALRAFQQKNDRTTPVAGPWPIDMTAGQGLDNSYPNGGDWNIAAGSTTVEFGNGGDVSVTAGDGGSSGRGGSVDIVSGAGNTATTWGGVGVIGYGGVDISSGAGSQGQIYIHAGTGIPAGSTPGAGEGGATVQIEGGYDDTGADQPGGDINLVAGYSTGGTGGNIDIEGGQAGAGKQSGIITLQAAHNNGGGSPGYIDIKGGNANTTGNSAGGDVKISGGSGHGTGRHGLIIVGAGTLPSVDPSVSNALWSDNGTVVLSGHTAAGAVTVEDEGTPVDTAVTTFNFTGAGVTASQTSPGVVEVAVSGGGGGSLTVEDEGSIVDSAVTTLNFTGSGVTASQTSAGVVQVAVSGGGGGGTIVPPEGRLTLVSGTPVMTSDQTAKSAVYYTPYTGAQFPIYSGSAWSMLDFTELTLTLDTSNHLSGSVYDVFVWSNTGTPSIGTGPAWSSSSARGTGAGTTELEQLNGKWVNKNTITLKNGAGSGTTGIAARTALYVGTIYCTGNGQTGMAFTPAAAAGGSNAILGVWNAYNRVTVGGRSQDSTATWTYSSTTWRAMDNSSSNRVSYVDGLGQSTARAALNLLTTGAYAAFGINLNSTTAAPAATASTDTSGDNISITSAFMPTLGLNYVQAMEVLAAGTTFTVYGAASSPTRQSNTLMLQVEM